MGKRILVAASFVLLAVAGGLLLQNPQWVANILPQSAEVPAVPDADSLQRALEHEASVLVAGQQRAAIAWLREMETALPPGAQLAALTTTPVPGTFVLRGISPTHETLSALQESLVLIPGVDLRRSEVRSIPGAVEFLFSGAFTPPPDSSFIPDRVLAKNALDGEVRRFLAAAAFAGIEFISLPASAPTAAGAFQTNPFRLSSPGKLDLLREFLENEFRRDSPFGIQRILLEKTPDSAVVFFDIMAFSR